MWCNSADSVNQSVVQEIQFAHKDNGYMGYQIPYQNYQGYTQHTEFSHIPSDYSNYAKYYAQNHQNLHVAVKAEPGFWNQHSYYNHTADSSKTEADKYMELSNHPFYKQCNEEHINYNYDPKGMSKNLGFSHSANKINTQQRDSPALSVLSNSNYGSASSNASPVNNTVSTLSDDSPNLRAMLTKPLAHRWTPYGVTNTEAIQAEVNQQSKTELPDWESVGVGAAQSECNLREFHGRYDASHSNTQASIKDKREHKGNATVGVAGISQGEGASSLLATETENCQDMTRVDAGGDKDYVEDKMAADQGIYPWMKSTNCKIYLRLFY